LYYKNEVFVKGGKEVFTTNDANGRGSHGGCKSLSIYPLISRGCSKTSVFGTATLDLIEKAGANLGSKNVFSRACYKTNRVLEQAQ